MFNAMEGKIQAMAEEIEMREGKLAMIDENEEKVAVYEKTNQNNEWSGAEFLSFN